MTCVKTGARIYFDNYGMSVVGDVYLIDNTFIFRWNIDSIEYGDVPVRTTHRIDYIVDSSSWWHREYLGITVVPRHLVIEMAER